MSLSDTAETGMEQTRISDMKIGVRLGAAFALVVALLIGTAVVGTQRLNDNDTKMGRVVSERHSLTALSNQIKNSGYRANGILNNLLPAASADQKAKYMNDYVAIRQTNGQACGRLEKVLTIDASKALSKGQLEAYSAHDTDVCKFFGLIDANKPEDARVLHQSDMSRLQDQYYVLVDKMVDHQASEIEHDVGEVAAQNANTRIQTTILAVLAMLLAIATGGFITHAITGPIHRAVYLAEAVVQGDLTHRLGVGAQDEVDRLLVVLKHMAENLRGVIDRVHGGTGTITRVPREVVSGNIDLSSRTGQQASSPEETAAAMEQLTSIVKQNTDNTQETNRLASNISLMAAKGGDAASEAIETVSAINASSHKIVDIIGVIDSIVFQTSTLALNAAVEATRVGKQDRGFVVAAGEVCNLAQRNAATVKEIKGLIEDSANRAGTGTARVKGTGQIIRDVVAGVQNTTSIVAETSASSREQNEGIEQINKAITQMDRVTQESASLVEENATLAQALQDQADRLAEMVSASKLHGDMPGHAHSVQGETATAVQTGQARVQTLS